MLVVLSVCGKDVESAIKLAQWMERLGGGSAFDSVLVADAGTPFDKTIELREGMGKVFKSVTVRATDTHIGTWPSGPNQNWKTAAIEAKQRGHHWLFLESDAIPMKHSWLQELDEEYVRRGKKYLGNVYECGQPFLPSRVMSGVAVYGPDAIDDIAPLPQTPRAWEIDAAERMIAEGAHTEKIKHFYGQMDLPPVFVHSKSPQSPVNALTLDWLHPDCVLFHRDKSHSLVRILERRLFPNDFKEKIIVAMNVHAGDVNLALCHSQWLRTMARGKKWGHKAIVCHDPSCPVTALNYFEQNLRHCFVEVESFVYQRPPIPSYPASANWAFQSVALHMTNQSAPWFWFEADGVALKPDWLDQIQAEYERCDASWMGPVVPHMNHLQGTAVYPFDAARRMPRAMACGAGAAFDMEAHHDTIHDRHDCSHLMFHTWSILHGQFCPVGGGAVPVNISPELARTIPPSAVFAHRFKDESLVKLLLSGEFRP